ncbi:MAG: H-NS histone family protein [Paracoccus sp. (in: a-proteobacteria)]|uniref:H-NS histone family protein n=1 Tax=Paracoccus sp. TaxID=267 RepID=UPI0026E0B32A|nr:H-NS histone family protein [Paracoccus sp. (in: a-proteobacteria)]MDO5621008.1 H-NS histone family protein [Paracoccus sp. (in: a-proteobacteria)]
MNLDNLSLSELRELRNRVERAITSFEQRKKREALAAAEEAARALGFNLAELTGGKISRRSSAAPKYANPADTTQTWSGRGRQPVWVKEYLAAGKTLEDLAI